MFSGQADELAVDLEAYRATSCHIGAQHPLASAAVVSDLAFMRSMSSIPSSTIRRGNGCRCRTNGVAMNVDGGDAGFGVFNVTWLASVGESLRVLRLLCLQQITRG